MAAPEAVPTRAPESGPAVAIRTRKRPGVPARAAALLLSGQQGGGIGISALAVPVSLGATGVRLFYAVDVDGASLLAGEEGTTLSAEIAVYAVNPQGGVGGSAVEAFDLDVGRAAEYLVGGGIKFLGALDLPAAPYALRALVRNVHLGTFGAVEVARALPVGGEPFAFLSQPLVSEPADAWLLARETGQEGALHPFPFLGEGVVPATAPVLPGGTVTRLWVLGRGLSPGTLSLSVRVLDTGAHELAKVSAAVIARAGAPSANTTALRIEFPLPQLPPGQYTLEVSAPGMNPDIPLWSATRFLMAEKAAAGKSQVWVRFAPAAAAGEHGRPQVAFTGKTGRAKASPAIEAAYRSAIRTVVSDHPAALDAVAALEAASLPTGKAAEWETLVLSEVKVAQELGAANPAALLGLVLLHSDLHRNYAMRKANLLEIHARRMVEDLAVFHAEVGKTPGARAVSADALASLAGSLQGPGTMGSSERLFRRALEIDPNNAAALMAVAATRERVGQYHEAVKPLETLVKVQPGNAEARLRLAVNIDRAIPSGRKGPRLLQACIGPDNPGWIRTVAYQELASGFIREAQFREAERLLREALAVVPGEEGLTLQLAYVLDRQHRPVEAQALVAGIGVQKRGEEESPRFRYSDWPSEDLDRAREALRRQAPAANEALVAALAPGAGRKSGDRQ